MGDVVGRYIWHVALGSGDATREPCGYTEEQLSAWMGHIRDALTDSNGAAIPDKAGYSMTARDIGGVLLCTVGRADDKTALVTFTAVERSSKAAKAWQALHHGYPEFAASLGRVPQAPYCAVRAESGLAHDRAAGEWLDGYELAVAWAWISMRRRDA